MEEKEQKKKERERCCHHCHGREQESTQESEAESDEEEDPEKNIPTLLSDYIIIGPIDRAQYRATTGLELATDLRFIENLW